MESRFFSLMTDPVYFALWNKYRPAILQLMLAAEHGPQQYRLFGHEFKAANAREKNYTFALSAFEGKALNNIKASKVAQELLSVLNTSKKATELLMQHTFEFSLDKQFQFHVERKKAEIDPEVNVQSL